MDLVRLIGRIPGSDRDGERENGPAGEQENGPAGNRGLARGWNDETGPAAGRRKGQLVLATAAVIAVALAPVVLAYLQLGYHGDVQASAEYDDPAVNAERFLGRATHEASAGIPRVYPWQTRRAAVRAVRARLDGPIAVLAGSRVAEGTAYEVDYNRRAARRWAGDDCPGGRGRSFGDCEAIRGVVVQDRVGETHVIAVAFDVTVTTERGHSDLTFLVLAISDS